MLKLLDSAVELLVLLLKVLDCHNFVLLVSPGHLQLIGKLLGKATFLILITLW